MGILSKSALSGILILGSLSATDIAAAQEFRNLHSINFPDRVIRHRNNLIFIEPQSDRLSLLDSAFHVKSGLAGSCSSFESKNFPNFFMRHQNGRLKLHQFENSDLFRKDATFCIRDGLGDPKNGKSLESINFPGSFVRQQNFEVFIRPNDGSPAFAKDATFRVDSAVVAID